MVFNILFRWGWGCSRTRPTGPTPISLPTHQLPPLLYKFWDPLKKFWTSNFNQLSILSSFCFLGSIPHVASFLRAKRFRYKWPTPLWGTLFPNQWVQILHPLRAPFKMYTLTFGFKQYVKFSSFIKTISQKEANPNPFHEVFSAFSSRLCCP